MEFRPWSNLADAIRRRTGSRRVVEVPELVELVDLTRPVSPVVTRPVVMRRAHVPFDPFDPPPTLTPPPDAVVAAN
jgi:hypothetical protein